MGNLAYDTTEAELIAKMGAVGRVRTATIMKLPDGRAKGFAIVEFERESAARRALAELDRTELRGRPLYLLPEVQGKW